MFSYRNFSLLSTDNSTADDVRACVDAASDMNTSITGAAGVDTGAGAGDSSSKDSSDK
ncbi:MAG: hypothetical protein HC815_32565 [Richelia sp. RM1_1_1]|nr:hypothetical protein [Richelia sp. RM1_1_1]